MLENMIFDDDFQRVELSEGDIVANCRPNTIYTHPFGNGTGKFINVVTVDDEDRPTEVDVVLGSRIKATLTFIFDKKDINGVHIKKYRYRKKRDGAFEWVEDQNEEIKLSGVTFQKLRELLTFLSRLDLGAISERRLELPSELDVGIDDETGRKLRTLLLSADGKAIVHEVIRSGLITSTDIVNVGYRKEQLQVFHDLLFVDGTIETYRLENSIKARGDEIVWQLFFEKNPWIFGYGLNYFFNTPLEGEKLEQVVSGYDISDFGKRADALLKTGGVISSMCLVEIKTSKTDLLADEYRTGCWKISNDLGGGIVQSQITVQKTLENVRMSPRLQVLDASGAPTGEIVFSYKPKSVLVIGNLSEFVKSDGAIEQNKFACFELFRRDLLNPEVITFDELYARAKMIVSSQENIPS